MGTSLRRGEYLKDTAGRALIRRTPPGVGWIGIPPLTMAAHDRKEQ